MNFHIFDDMWSIYFKYSHVFYVNKELSMVNFHIFDDTWSIYFKYSCVIVVNKKLSIVNFHIFDESCFLILYTTL